MRRPRRTVAALAGLATLAGTTLALIGLTSTAAFGGTNPNTTYELDCTTALSPGTVAPFAVTLNLNGAPDPSFPTGATFGASGALTVALSGGFIAGFASNGVLTPAGVGISVNNAVISSTDGTASGSFTYNHTFAQVPATTSTVAGVTWASASTTLSGPFAAGDVGDGVTGGTGLPQGATIIAVVPGTSATINAPTTAAQATGVTVTLYTPMAFTDATLSTGNVYTTTGTNGGHANVGLTSLGGFTIAIALSLPFGGAPGVGGANCLETGYDAASNPGPLQTGETAPAFPPPALGGPETPLVLATGGFVAQPGTTQQITPPAAAFVSLADAPPTANNSSVNLGVGGSKTVSLSTTDTDLTGTTGCSLVGTPSNARLSVTIDNTPSICSAHLSDSGTGVATVTFQFNATDGVSTGNTATVTVAIGTPPADEPLTQQVNPGQLVISCADPSNPVLLTCPEFQFPSITLNGVQQTTTGAGNTLYVSDNRGDPTVGWNLTASMVATPIGAGSNTNTSCSGVVAFCNADVGTHALDASGNGQISPSHLSIGSISCTPHAGNLNPAATPGGGGNFASTESICSAVATQSGGTFDVNKTYTLTIPSSVYAGNYWGTVEYLVQ